MIAAWMLRMLVATALIAVGARATEEAARLLGRPRRWVWAAALALAVALPWLGGIVAMPAAVGDLVGRLLPGGTAGGGPALPGVIEITAVGDGAGAARAGGAAGGAIEMALLAGWALASLGVALAFGRALRRFRAVRWRGRAGERGDVAIVRSEALGPATVGIVRPTIVLPRWVDELTPADRALIVEHEREHAAARDPGLLAAAALPLLVAPWCLPLWWIHRRLRDAAEADCDARVLARGADRRAYGRALLSTAGRPSAAPFVAPALAGANITRLRRRILMMTEPRPKHALLRAVPLLAIAAVAAFVACDAAGDTATAPDERAETVTAEGTVEYVGETVGHDGPAIEYVGERNDVEPEGGATARAEALLRALETNIQDTVAARGTLTLRETPGEPASDAGGWYRVRATGPEHDAGATGRDREAWLQASRGAISARFEDGGPVIYIDGERIGGGARATLDDLDPSRIERIEVLKGAAATAEYGADHAGGVIQIFTKQR